MHPSSLSYPKPQTFQPMFKPQRVENVLDDIQTQSKVSIAEMIWSKMKDPIIMKEAAKRSDAQRNADQVKQVCISELKMNPRLVLGGGSEFYSSLRKQARVVYGEGKGQKVYKEIRKIITAGNRAKHDPKWKTA